MRIFGLDIEERGRDKAIAAIGGLSDEWSQVAIATLNPEILLKARADGEYRNVLQSMDLRVADGFGVFMGGVYHLRRIQRVTGREILDLALEKAAGEGRAAFVALRRGGLTSRHELESALERRYPGLKATVVESAADGIASSDSAEIVVCGFGAPEQERWIAANRSRFPKAKILVGVGGAFDVLTGKLPSSPAWLAAIGLEWVWRLVIQPRRWKRILRATIVFPTLFMKDAILDRENNR